MIYVHLEYKNTSDSLYSILVTFIRNYKYPWSVNDVMKMQIIHLGATTRNLLVGFLVVYILFSAIFLSITESQGKRDYSKKSAGQENNDIQRTGNAIGVQGDQLIYCEGDLSSCHNVLTNIICSNVKYCIVGDITPFVMSNPL
jgi:hypothetical protein